jgi:hypothetical protein
MFLRFLTALAIGMLLAALIPLTFLAFIAGLVFHPIITVFLILTAAFTLIVYSDI